MSTQASAAPLCETRSAVSRTSAAKQTWPTESRVGSLTCAVAPAGGIARVDTGTVIPIAPEPDVWNSSSVSPSRPPSSLASPSAMSKT